VDRSVATKALLNEGQQRRLLANARYADQLLSDIENILTASESKAAFPKYRPDVSPHQARLIRSHIARLRTHLTRALAAAGLQHEGPRFGALHSIRVTLTFVRIAVQEMAPDYLRGYGELSEEAAMVIRGLCSELEGLLNSLEQNLALGDAADLQARLARLDRTSRETDLLRLLDQIIGQHELAEFRSPLLQILEKLESGQFEIAVFGRVSSGKSSLLNHILHTEVLPVGVTPITAVPTRLVYGREPLLTVTFSDRRVKQCPVEELDQYASEEQNPGNRLGVAKLIVQLPSPRLQEGLVLVDTPGLGALASAGAAETLAYLPQCDLGIVLVSAVNPINDEDLNTVYSLAQAGIPVMLLLSKADLLSPEDRRKALAYTKQEVAANLNLDVTVHPVSTVAGYEELLEKWFVQGLAPLYQRHRQLARESVRRKAGALRDAVLAALQSRLAGAAASAPADMERLQDIERKLREAAANLDQTRRACLSLTDEVRLLAPAAMARAAAAAAQSWEGPAALRAIEETAAHAAAQLSERLRDAAHELDTILNRAARELGGAPAENPLENCLREMPRFEAALPEFSLPPPWFRAFHGLARSWAERKLRQKLQQPLSDAFTNFGRALEAWSRRVLGEIQDGFEARADPYRAQLTRLLAGSAVSGNEKERIQAAIAELEKFTPPDSGRATAPHAEAPAGSDPPGSGEPPVAPT
jgi:GTP-binding protein EngB required for normal cell division